MTIFLSKFSFAQVTGVNYGLIYNPNTCLYDATLKVNAGSATTSAQRLTGNAQFSFVVPTGASVSLVTDSNPIFAASGLPIPWTIGSPTSNPGASPGNDFYPVTPTLSPTSRYPVLVTGQRIVLFSLKIRGANCGKGIRMWDNTTDPNPVDLDMNGRQFDNGFTIGNAIQKYQGNDPTNYPNAPLLTTPASVCLSSTLNINISATPSASCAVPLAYSWSGPNSYSSTTQNVAISSASAVNLGTYKVVTTDSLGCKDTAFVNVVNCSTINVPDTAITTPANTPKTVCVTVSNPNNGTLVPTITCGPLHGTLSAPTVSGNVVCVTYTPTTGYVGPDSVCLKVCDGTTCDTGKIAITVTPLINPKTEKGTVPSATGGTAIPNIASNDSVNGSPAVIGTNATVSPSGVWPSGITLDSTTGAVNVVPGTPAGIYPISYQLCDKLTPKHCTTMLDTVIVTSSSCVSPPTVNLASNSGTTCGTTPMIVNGNTFGGSATSVTLSHNGLGTLTPTSASISPFSYTYTPAAGDAGNIVTITATTNNPAGAPCSAATATYALTVNAQTGWVVFNANQATTSSLTTTLTGTSSFTTGNITISNVGTHNIFAAPPYNYVGANAPYGDLLDNFGGASIGNATSGPYNVFLIDNFTNGGSGKTNAVTINFPNNVKINRFIVTDADQGAGTHNDQFNLTMGGGATFGTVDFGVCTTGGQCKDGSYGDAVATTSGLNVNTYTDSYYQGKEWAVWSNPSGLTNSITINYTNTNPGPGHIFVAIELACPVSCANAGPDQTVACFSSGTATMAGTGTGTWTLGSGSAGTATITNPSSPITTVTGFSATGVYTLIWTNGSCADTALINANNTCSCASPPTVALSSTSGSTCGLNPITVSSNTFGGSATSVSFTSSGTGTFTSTTVSSSPFSFTYTPSAADAGTTVTITATTNNPNGAPCTAATATYALSVVAKPNAGADQTVSCFSTGTVTLSGTGTGTWSVGAGSAGTATITTPTSPTSTVTGFSVIGTYYLIWTKNGCSDTTLITAGNTCSCVSPPTIALSATSGNTCGVTPVTISSNTFGGSATSVSFTSSGTGTFTSNSASSSPFSFTYTPSAVDAGTTVTITATTNNPNGAPCSAATATYALTVNAVPAVFSGCPANPTVCISTPLTMSCLPTGGIYSIVSGPGSVSGNQLTSTGAGIINLQYTVTNNGCSGSTTFSATGVASSSVTLNSIASPVCFNTMIVLTATATGGAGTYTYSWSPNAGLGDTSNGSVNVGLIAGTNTYSVSVTSGVCTTTASTNVAVNSSACPPITALCNPTNPTTCSSLGTISAVGSGGALPYSYFWSNGTTGTNTINVSAGTYSVTIKDAFGVSAVCSSTLVAPSSPTLSVNPVSQTICSGDSAVINVTTSVGATVTYKGSPWQDGGTGNPNIVLMPQNWGTTDEVRTYTIVSLLNGCTNTTTASVIVKPRPQLTPHPVNLVLCSSGTVALNVTSNLPGAITWSSNLPSNGTGGIINEIVTNPSTSTVLNLLYTFNQTYNGCAAYPLQTPVTVSYTTP